MSGANEAQREQWNAVSGPKWLRHEAAQEAHLRPIADLLLATAAAAAGEAVLEIGCGAGTLLAPLSARVGPTGRVTGIDISATMLEVARSRAPHTVRLIEADAQTATLPGPFDLMVSRFGVMFFADPRAAFANLRAALAPAGRLCLVCWGPLADNPHWADPLAIAERVLGPAAPRVPHAPGPMAFADPARLRAILAAGGFGRVDLATVRVPLAVASAADAADLAVNLGPAGALISERKPEPAALSAIRDEIAARWSPQAACIHRVIARR